MVVFYIIFKQERLGDLEEMRSRTQIEKYEKQNHEVTKLFEPVYMYSLLFKFLLAIS